MLPERPGDLRFGSARNHAAVMRAVRKAEAMGVRVRRAETTRELRHWYRLYLEVMRHHSVPPRPYRFFAAMWEELAAKGMLRLLLAEAPAGARRRIVAGSIFLMSGHTVVFAMNGRRGEDLAVRPNEAIHWRAIHDATSEGYRRYDLGEVEPGHEGLERFKRKWGAEPRPLHRLYVPPLPDARAVTDERRSPGALWQRLPLTATAAAGGLLYRFI
jgi:lipid II:glycine glycyltransferase (peptidoglycan interpeptide bridge formation enzyme)